MYPKRRVILWISFWIGLFIVMHRPLRDVGILPFPWFDKIVHFTLYAILAGLGAWSFHGLRGYLTSAFLWRWAGIYAAYGVADEYLQPFVGRTGSVADWLADVSGVATATVLAILWQRPKRRSAGMSSEDPAVL
jgi:hypothetical protein